jgi:hypothetical protein
MFGKTQPPPPLRIDLAQPVWFLLIEVEVTGNSVQPWIAGSRAMVQAYVPCKDLENAFRLLDAYLATQELVRIDTIRANRHEPDDEYDELPEAYIREPLEQASRSNECKLGVFVVSQDTAWPHKETGE